MQVDVVANGPYATLVANWSDGVPLVAYKSAPFTGRVVWYIVKNVFFFPPVALFTKQFTLHWNSLNFNPVSDAVDILGWNKSTDGARLIANSLNFGFASPSGISCLLHRFM